MSDADPRLRGNVEGVRERMRAACQRSGRDPASVRLVAVTKYASLEWVRQLPEVGVPVLGESRPQQLVERAAVLTAGVEWHLIGHLQRNKVRAVLPLVELIHSVDSMRLLERIDLIAGELVLRPRVLLEVNISGEESKDGFAAHELSQSWGAIRALTHVQVEGLMTMATLEDNPELARPTFRVLRQFRDELQHQSGAPLPELSMGMSNDFEVAIEEGATLVRVGSLLFEGLEPPG
jgi:hypothetical protein